MIFFCTYLHFQKYIFHLYQKGDPRNRGPCDDGGLTESDQSDADALSDNDDSANVRVEGSVSGGMPRYIEKKSVSIYIVQYKNIYYYQKKRRKRKKRKQKKNLTLIFFLLFFYNNIYFCN